MMRIRKTLVLLFSFLLVLGSFSFKPPSQEQEYILKAAFLYRFSDYIEWTNIDNAETFNIAILGESGISAPLVEISRDKRIKNKRIVVKQYGNADEAGSCQIIFISRDYRLPVEQVFRKVDYRPVLVITEQRSDFDKGGQMNFIIEDNKLKFEVNLATVNRSGLKISSQLLQHASKIWR